jgi:predicted dehydrogenase
VQVAKAGGEWETMPLTHGHVEGEFRSIGVADMATAIVTNRPHRASGTLALHVLEVTEAFQTSAEEGRRVKIESRVERPAIMPAGRDTGQID